MDVSCLAKTPSQRGMPMKLAKLNITADLDKQNAKAANWVARHNRLLNLSSVDERDECDSMVIPRSPYIDVGPDIFGFVTDAGGEADLYKDSSDRWLSRSDLKHRRGSRCTTGGSASGVLSSLRMPIKRGSMSSTIASGSSNRSSWAPDDAQSIGDGRRLSYRSSCSNSPFGKSQHATFTYSETPDPYITGQKILRNGHEYPNIVDTYGRYMVQMSMSVNHNTGPSFWIGCEYRYLIVSKKLKLNIIRSGRLPELFKDSQKIFVKLKLSGSPKRSRTISLGRVGAKNSERVEMNFVGFSCAEIIQQTLSIRLYVKNGIFGRSRNILEWQLPLNSCHFLCARTAWKNISSADIK